MLRTRPKYCSRGQSVQVQRYARTGREGPSDRHQRSTRDEYRRTSTYRLYDLCRADHPEDPSCSSLRDLPLLRHRLALGHATVQPAENDLHTNEVPSERGLSKTSRFTYAALDGLDRFSRSGSSDEAQHVYIHSIDCSWFIDYNQKHELRFPLPVYTCFTCAISKMVSSIRVHRTRTDGSTVSSFALESLSTPLSSSMATKNRADSSTTKLISTVKSICPFEGSSIR